MPNGYDYSKEYGDHSYNSDGTFTVDCGRGCGCSMGPSMSHSGRAGLDPHGECPGNPKDGRSAEFGRNKDEFPQEADFDVVIERRIRKLDKRAREAEARAKSAEERAEKGTDVLQAERDDARRRLDQMRGRLRAVGESVDLMKGVVDFREEDADERFA